MCPNLSKAELKERIEPIVRALTRPPSEIVRRATMPAEFARGGRYTELVAALRSQSRGDDVDDEALL
jgi:hypothetical protein